MENKKQKNSITSLFLMIFAILLSVILYPLGIIYTFLLQPLFIYVGKRNLFRYFWDFIVQIYVVVMNLCFQIAYSFDILGNVVVGDLIELFATKEKETLFANKDYTISQSLGYIQEKNILTKNGARIIQFVDFIFGKNHCINAYINDNHGRNK